MNISVKKLNSLGFSYLFTATVNGIATPASISSIENTDPIVHVSPDTHEAFLHTSFHAGHESREVKVSHTSSTDDRIVISSLRDNSNIDLIINAPYSRKLIEKIIDFIVPGIFRWRIV